jgi:hypothetical protein
MALTATYALARTVVREAAERWPDWWDADLFGPPHREAEVPVLEALHDGLRRLKLVRRRARRLYTTPRGRELMGEDAELISLLLGDLGGGDPFAAMIAQVVLDKLAAGASRSHDELVKSACRAAWGGGWRSSDGQLPGEQDVSWVLGEVLCRGAAYGVIERCREAGQSRYRSSQIALTRAARAALGLDSEQPTGTVVLVFDAELLNASGVRARLAVDAGQHLTALHNAIVEAFGWDDDHLYSFWLDGEFWGSTSTEFARPSPIAEASTQTADVPLVELDLAVGASIAYIFDYGDEWRVRLVLREYAETDGGAYPRVLDRVGTAPPQYRVLD